MRAKFSTHREDFCSWLRIWSCSAFVCTEPSSTLSAMVIVIEPGQCNSMDLGNALGVFRTVLDLMGTGGGGLSRRLIVLGGHIIAMHMFCSVPQGQDATGSIYMRKGRQLCFLLHKSRGGQWNSDLKPAFICKD